MCGRFALAAMPKEVQEAFGLMTVDDFPPRYNIAPTQPILIVMAAPPRAPGDNRPEREALLARWGLLPGWVKDEKAFPVLFNARSETAAEKPAFRAAIRHRRVLVPASGFYEWRKAETRKAKAQPFWVRPRDGGILAFAGLMETYAGADGSEIDTATILTVAANATLAPIHPRMPVVVRREDFQRWLDCRANEPRDVADLLTPAPDDFFEAVPVGDAVNAVANDNPAVQEQASIDGPAADGETEEPGPGKDGQLSLF